MIDDDDDDDDLASECSICNVIQCHYRTNMMLVGTVFIRMVYAMQNVITEQNNPDTNWYSIHQNGTS